MTLEQSIVDEFARDGVVVLRGVFGDWVDTLAAGVAHVMANPSRLHRIYKPQDGSAVFFQDYCTWMQVPEFRSFVFESPAAVLAAQLMRSNEARFFHEHVLVKMPGNSTVTPWHHDQPYYCVDGDQSVSFWTPLDPVSRPVSLQCVAGSHRWNARGFRPLRFDGTPLYPNDDFEQLPDIDAQREHLPIRSWELQPGDAVAFHFKTVHGARGNHSTVARRAFSSRWVGADARYIDRGAAGSPPFHHLKMQTGAMLDAADFPLVYSRRAEMGV